MGSSRNPEKVSRILAFRSPPRFVRAYVARRADNSALGFEIWGSALRFTGLFKYGSSKGSIRVSWILLISNPDYGTYPVGPYTLQLWN